MIDFCGLLAHKKGKFSLHWKKKLDLSFLSYFEWKNNFLSKFKLYSLKRRAGIKGPPNPKQP